MLGIEHNLLLAGKITGSVIGSLIGVAFLISTVRTILDGKAAPWVPGDIPAAMKQASEEGWAHRSLVAFDIGFNVVFLRGQPDETISTHAWRASTEGKIWGKWMSDWLGWFQANHGQKAACGDLERATVRVVMLKKFLGIQ